MKAFECNKMIALARESHYNRGAGIGSVYKICCGRVTTYRRWREINQLGASRNMKTQTASELPYNQFLFTADGAKATQVSELGHPAGDALVAQLLGGEFLCDDDLAFVDALAALPRLC